MDTLVLVWVLMAGGQWMATYPSAAKCIEVKQAVLASNPPLQVLVACVPQEKEGRK